MGTALPDPTILHIRPHPSGYVVTGNGTTRSFIRKDSAWDYCLTMCQLGAAEGFMDDDPTGEFEDEIERRSRDFRDEYLSRKWL